MQTLATIPIMRIFDRDKALEFYRDYLGLEVDWEHRFDPEAPVYMQLSGHGLKLHLSEHHGDGTPGTIVYVSVTGIDDYHQELMGRPYPRMRPGVEETPWGSRCMEVIDPFGNRLRLDEALEG